jgi:hypothetical protein
MSAPTPLLLNELAARFRDKQALKRLREAGKIPEAADQIGKQRVRWPRAAITPSESVSPKKSGEILLLLLAGKFTRTGSPVRFRQG